MYGDFAQIYDELMREIDYKQWADYIFRHMLNGKREVKKVLEFGCGTGNITCELAKKGFEMTAVDISEEMLTMADEKAAEEKLNNIRFFMGDMSNFQIGEKFDAVISCCDSVNYLEDLESVHNFLESSYEVLEDEGMLLFDINTETKFKEIIGDNTFVYNLDDIFCVWENVPDFKAGRMDYDLSFFVKQENGLYARYDESQSQFIYKVEDIFHAIKQIGFTDIKVLTFGTFMPGGNESERVQFVATKK